MKRTLLKSIVLGLIVILIFNMISTAFAYQTEQRIPERMGNLNKSEQ